MLAFIAVFCALFGSGLQTKSYVLVVVIARGGVKVKFAITGKHDEPGLELRRVLKLNIAKFGSD